jgi:hypothetical protein
VNGDKPDMPQCAKCGGKTVRGYIPDQNHYNVLLNEWVEGEPKESFFGVAIKRANRDGIPIGAFRCEQCGFIELYARREFRAS